MNTPTYQRCNATSDRTSAWFAYGDRWRPFAAVLRDEVESGPAYWVAIPGPAFPAPFPYSAKHAVDLPVTGIGHTREAALADLVRNQSKES